MRFDTLNEYILYLSTVDFGGAMTITDHNQTYCYVSEYFKNALGTSNELIGHNLKDTDSFLAKYAPSIKETTDRMSKNSLLTNYSYLLKVRRGNYFWIAHVYINKLLNRQGEYLGDWAIIRIVSAISPLLCDNTDYEFQNIIILSDDTLIQEQNLEHILPTKEHEIIILLGMHKSHKEIAEILSNVHKTKISSQVITTTISRSIYPRFNVTTTAELLKTCSGHALLDYFPRKLFEELTK
ncbi:MAG: PAS domain-containing protein [Burkholderiales bacterium]|nr:PAS domain-containing protein [Burkholderiales bacterium]